MVSLENISIKDGYMIAYANNEETGFSESIRAKMDGSYHSSSDTDIIKATWNIVVEYEKTGKMPKKAYVAWG